jgi:hypothetical protein
MVKPLARTASERREQRRNLVESDKHDFYGAYGNLGDEESAGGGTVPWQSYSGATASAGTCSKASISEGSISEASELQSMPDSLHQLGVPKPSKKAAEPVRSTVVMDSSRIEGVPVPTPTLPQQSQPIRHPLWQRLGDAPADPPQPPMVRKAIAVRRVSWGELDDRADGSEDIDISRTSSADDDEGLAAAGAALVAGVAFAHVRVPPRTCARPPVDQVATDRDVLEDGAVDTDKSGGIEGYEEDEDKRVEKEESREREERESPDASSHPQVFADGGEYFEI